MQMTAKRVISFYDLMDSAYDADLIWSFSRKLLYPAQADRLDWHAQIFEKIAKSAPLEHF